MSSDHVETLRAAYEAFARQDVRAVTAAFDDDIEWEVPDSVPFGGSYHGHDGVGRFFGQLSEYWEVLKVEPEEFIDAGEAIVVLIRLSGRGAGGSLDTRSLCDGRAPAFREYPDTARVLQALGQAVSATR